MSTAEATETATEFDSVTKEMGDKLVGLTLLEAKKLVDYLEEEHGIAPAAGGGVMMAGPGAGDGGGGAVEEQTEFDVILTNLGDKKIQVINAVREIGRAPVSTTVTA